MSGIHEIFSIAERALLAQQTAMNVVSSNISNAQNPNYSRQRPHFSDDTTTRVNNFFLGMGARVESIQRARDRIYDSRIWQENGAFGQLDKGQKYIKMTEPVFTDFAGSGLSGLLDDFWNGWNELANHPENPAVRASLRGKANQLTGRLNEMDSQLRSLANQAVQELGQDIDKVNQLTREIAKLNQHVQKNRATNGLDNSTLDRRDALVDALSNYVDVTASFDDDGTVTLSASGHVLVDKAVAFDFSLKTENVAGEPRASLTLYGSRAVELRSGSLKSLVDWANSNTSDKRKHLDEIAQMLVERVNSVHADLYALGGDTGIDFFDPAGATAGSIKLSQSVLSDLANIAVSENGQRGDGAGALQIGSIRDAKVLNNGTSTIDEVYRSIVSMVGQEGSEIQTKLETQTDVVNMLETQRQSIMGVSLEEEMLSLIQYQNAFEAASKVIQTADEMMQTVINMVG
jgi:flagellar hook-associated protein 1 FlgK